MISGRRAFISAIFLLFAVTAAAATEPKRVLLFHSFGLDFAPWNEYAKNIRAEINQQAKEPIDIHDVSLATARFAEETSEGPLVDYIHSLFANHKLDLIITIGAPAARFFQTHRQEIFPETPVIFSALEQRRVPGAESTTNDTAVALKIDFVGIVENILQLLPETKNIAVVMGSSPLEKYWITQLREAFAPYADRIKFTWFDQLTFEEMLKRAATLEPQSAIFFGLLAVDAAGVPQEQHNAVERLHAVANAPMFTYVDAYFGRGIVGGPLISVSQVSHRAATIAVRILDGEAASKIRAESIGFGTPRFDWRELQHWNISEKRLPAGSIVAFRVPTVLEEYKWYLVAATALFTVQAFFIGALLMNRRRLERERVERQQAEKAARDLSGRLISAQEDERSRLGRELHDDVTQRLALLAIDAGRAERDSGNKENVATMREVRDGLIRLSEDVHALSYQLHPSILDDLGLIEALKTECERFSQIESIAVTSKLEENAEAPPDIALCLFRVAQEALRNVGRHAKANKVEVSLRCLDNGLQLCVSDDGIGFDSKHRRNGRSLGLASMQQRASLLGGELKVESAPGRGTIVVALVPVKEERLESPARAAG